MVMFHSYVSLPGGINAGETPCCQIVQYFQNLQSDGMECIKHQLNDELAVKPTNDFLGAGNAGNKPKGVPQNHHGWYQTQMVGLHGIGFTALFHNKGKVPTWWLIPLSKWVITPVISGLSLLIPFITGVITHLLSGMSHQAITILIALKTFSHQSPVAKL